MKSGVAPIDVAIRLGLTEEEYRNYHRQFLRLKSYHNLDKLYEELSGNDEELLHFLLFSRE